MLDRLMGNTAFNSLINWSAYGFALLFGLILQFVSAIAFWMIETGN